jgi:diguanylate cyclase (GGDEF)-like protein
MSTSSGFRSDLNNAPSVGFDLFDHEQAVISKAMDFLLARPEDAAGLRLIVGELVRAFDQSAREQRQLMRAGDRQQEQLRMATRELREKSGLLEEQARQLRILASTDALTGVYNRRRFLELGEYEHTRELRTRRGLCLLALDIDHFKKVNDTHGHAVGDATLVRFVQACASGLRAMDTLGRMGGEEFAVILPETSLAEACELAERTRVAVADAVMSGHAGPFQITVSIGVARMGPDESFETLMARADSQLYKAKHAGRNRWQAGPDPILRTPCGAPAQG